MNPYFPFVFRKANTLSSGELHCFTLVYVNRNTHTRQKFCNPSPPISKTQTRLNVMCCTYMYVCIWKKYVYLSIKVLKYYYIILIEIIIIVVGEVSDALWKMFTSFFFSLFLKKKYWGLYEKCSMRLSGAHHVFWDKNGMTNKYKIRIPWMRISLPLCSLSFIVFNSENIWWRYSLPPFS